MSMGITIQSCLGIVHSVHFWCSAENLPPQRNILPLSRKSSPSAKNHTPSAENSLPLVKIPEIQCRLCLKSINNVFFAFLFCWACPCRSPCKVLWESDIALIVGAQWKILPLSRKTSPISEKSSPLSRKYPPQQKILSPQQRYRRYKVSLLEIDQ
jgi:hypothetical protein